MKNRQNIRIGDRTCNPNGFVEFGNTDERTNRRSLFLRAVRRKLRNIQALFESKRFGKKLAGQSRTTGADRIDFANYLEGRNFTNYPNASGDGDYQSGAETGSFNDMLYCILSDLTVTPC